MVIGLLSQSDILVEVPVMASAGVIMKQNTMISKVSQGLSLESSRCKFPGILELLDKCPLLLFKGSVSSVKGFIMKFCLLHLPISWVSCHFMNN